MQRRFEADPMLRAADLLLQERVPKAVAPIFPHVAEASATRSASAEEEGAMRVFTDPSGPVPEVHLLSNGRYHVVITSAGGGYSRWRDLAVTRWREDATRDCWGTFCYLRDLDSGDLLVHGLAADAQAGQTLPGDLHAVPRRVPPQRRPDRHAYGNQRLARGRHRAAADHAHEPIRTAAHHRADQLCRGGPGPASP